MNKNLSQKALIFLIGINLVLMIHNLLKSELLPPSLAQNSESEAYTNPEKIIDLQPENFSQEDLNEQAILALNWMQLSGEYAALTHQTFNLAKVIFDEAIAKGVTNPAVILDIDETVLNNSPFLAGFVDTNNLFTTQAWNNWVKAKQATAIPGAVEFVNYVNNHGGKVFLISDRDESTTNDTNNNDLELATIANLQELGFTRISDDTVILRGEFPKTINDKLNTSKQWRREAVASGKIDGKQYTIVALLGDNLDDFDNQAGLSNQQRLGYVTTNRNMYGNFDSIPDNQKIDPAYLVLPNPTYGTWESVLYKPEVFGKQNWYEMTPAEKSQQRKENLIRINY